MTKVVKIGVLLGIKEEAKDCKLRDHKILKNW